MNNLNDLEKKYKEMGEEIERLKAKPTGGRLWLPEKDDEYCTVLHGLVASSHWHDSQLDYHKLAEGNVFRTADEAEEHAKYLQALYEVKKYIAENFPAWEPDINSIFYHIWSRNGVLAVAEYANHDILQLLPGLESREQAHQLIDDQKDNLLVLFGVKS